MCIKKNKKNEQKRGDYKEVANVKKNKPFHGTQKYISFVVARENNEKMHLENKRKNLKNIFNHLISTVIRYSSYGFSEFSKHLIAQNNKKLIDLMTHIDNDIFTTESMVYSLLNLWYIQSINIICFENLYIYAIIEKEFSEYYFKGIKLILRHYAKRPSLLSIIEEKYKPSRVQYIIDNYGLDALDDY
jgi:hypothetical protein